VILEQEEYKFPYQQHEAIFVTMMDETDLEDQPVCFLSC
jgi:hypothetical protein